MKIIDTHQHLWNKDLFTYSWWEKNPPLNRSFLLSDYLAAVDGLEIIRTVHLEADVDEPFMAGETKYILDLAESGGNPLEGVVACARPEKEGFQAYLENFTGSQKLKGIRRVLHTQPDELILHPTLVENIKSLAAYNLSFDVCVLSHQLPLAIKLIDACPQISFILDHSGNPPLLNASELNSWRESIKEIARFPNLVCKVSGLVTNADARRWTPEDLRPTVDFVIEQFGWDRVMFGSDWPVCTLAASFRQWVEALLFLTRDVRPSEREKLFYGNALRVYRLE
jgi:predicted TIM-barrel fold metal-dependent hydrolase